MPNKDLVKAAIAALLLVFLLIFITDFLVSLNLPEPWDVYIAVTVLGTVTGIAFLLAQKYYR